MILFPSIEPAVSEYVSPVNQDSDYEDFLADMQEQEHVGQLRAIKTRVSTMRQERDWL